MKKTIGISLFAVLAACSGQDRAEKERAAFIEARTENAAEVAVTAEEAAANAAAAGRTRAEFAAAGAAGEAAARSASAASAKAEASLTDTVKGKVCRAAIANVMGRDPSIIRVLNNSGGITRVRYTRDDGTVWTNECRVNVGNVEWRAIDAGRVGRWRTEDTIRYQISGSRITIEQFMSGEHIDTQTYTVS